VIIIHHLRNAVKVTQSMDGTEGVQLAKVFDLKVQRACSFTTTREKLRGDKKKNRRGNETKKEKEINRRKFNILSLMQFQFLYAVFLFICLFIYLFIGAPGV
jgi:hypothetical protein